MNTKIVGAVVAVLVALFVLPVLVQTFGGPKLVGSKWEGRIPGVPGAQASIKVEFLADGKLLFGVNMPGMSLPAGVKLPEMAGGWTLVADQLTLDFAGNSVIGTLDGDMIVFKKDKLSLRRVME